MVDEAIEAGLKYVFMLFIISTKYIYSQKMQEIQETR